MRLSLVAATFVVLSALPVAAADAPATMPAGHPAMGTMAPAREMPKATHPGTVIEVLPAGPYIYIHAKTAGGEEWLASNAMELKPGTPIKWNDGSVMTNYQSKSLNRTFDQVRFVEIVEVVKP